MGTVVAPLKKQPLNLEYYAETVVKYVVGAGKTIPKKHSALIAVYIVKCFKEDKQAIDTAKDCIKLVDVLQ